MTLPYSVTVLPEVIVLYGTMAFPGLLPLSDSFIVLLEVTTLYEQWLFQCDSVLSASIKEGGKIMLCLVCEVNSHHLPVVDNKSELNK